MNILPLDDFRYSIGYHPYHFWQLVNDVIPITSKCNSLVYEYAWQAVDSAGRNNVRDAISSAESRLREHLKFNIGHHYVEETIPFSKIKNPNLTRYANFDSRGLRLPLQLPEGHILGFGPETNLVIDPAVDATTLSDDFSDGVFDTFTLTVDITGFDVSVDEIAVYFVESDRIDNEAISQRWLVSPVKVTISGNTATIKGRSWLIIKPILYQGVVKRQIDPADPNNYVETLMVCKRYPNPDGTTINDSQAVLIWESCPDSCGQFITPCCNLTFESGYSDPSAEGYALARVGIRNDVTGWVTAGEAVYNTDGTWSEVDWGGCRQPDRVLFRYKAGIGYDETTSLQNGSSWKKILSRLAAAELMQRLCACDIANQELYRWQFDLSRSAGANDEQYQISQEDLNNPLGSTRAGAVYAWKQIKNLRQIRAYLP